MYRYYRYLTTTTLPYPTTPVPYIVLCSVLSVFFPPTNYYYYWYCYFCWYFCL